MESDSEKLLFHHSCRKVFDQPTIGGTIPDALWSLTYLSNLTLYRIGLSGSLSPSIANLTRMQYLYYYSSINKNM
ncbi:hypothetical protein SAY87_021917 [Trapa incisa]|uniref:Uncharacterized protein n=1 Tax=Trapa incisa TaxID=236973 RepID=A0AAN7JU21_9MYRT|nr:hypothetical protein SAY87_021917 [Trapa incisa]